uniref:Reverse transcriptase n=1 Tax=Cannabis sativa TaxID=3483 RepID=A0A803PJ70_CANSA
MFEDAPSLFSKQSLIEVNEGTKAKASIFFGFTKLLPTLPVSLWTIILIETPQKVSHNRLKRMTSGIGRRKQAMVNIHKEKWLNFKYESLPNICFHCGCGSWLFILCCSLGEVVISRLFGTNPIPSPEFLTSERANPVPAFPPGFNCATPIDAFCHTTQAALPTFTTAVHTTVDLGSDVIQAMARTTEKSKGKAIAGAKRSAFIPQSVMVGDSFRNILKRARAGPVINEPPNADDTSLQQAGVARVLLSNPAQKNDADELECPWCDSFRTRLSFDCAFEVPRNGLSGGLLLFWNNDVIVNILNYSSNHIDCIVTFNDNVTTHVSCFYGSPYVSDKIHTWVLLDRLFDNAPQLPWLILGDFNDYLLIADRSSRASLPHYATINFQAFVNKYSLTPIHFVGNKFTWKHGDTFERLDWGIANEKWFHQYPHAILHHLGFYGSDHRVLKLVLTDSSECRIRNKRFLFENHWLTEPSFFTTVNSSWSSPNSGANFSPLSSFLHKQNTCIQDIQTWNRSFNSLSFRIRDIDRQLNSISSLLPASPEQLAETSNLQSQLDSLLYKQELFWKQRSKVHWLRAGDKNTKFFHHKASSRKKTNFIRKLTLDDGRRPPVASLEAPFTSEEIKTALFQLSGDKAPGSDGLNAYFYQKNWSTLGGDLCAALLDILNNNASMASINKTLIVLIPKKSNASSLKDFRPISLCSTLYKIVSKAIANRIKPTMENIISPTQSAFLADRLIFDNILIAQEMVHAINHRKTGLAAALRIQEQHGNFGGISIARSAPAVSHLLFAEDTLIFAKATFSSCNALQAALHLYNQATGQRVNFGKSSILFSPNTPPQISDHFYQAFGLSNRPFLSKYLGVPQCFGRSKKNSFNFILDRVSSNLRVWSHKFFSRAGKEVLLKAVIQAIPSYAMSCYKLPVSICRKIESLMAQFWWGSFGNQSKAHWKSWVSLCQSKFFGGLGFRSLVHHNQALLAKQAWRVFTTPDSIASQILKPIGNGQNIRTLQDTWIPNLRTLRCKDSASLPSDRVSFFIKDNGTWDLNQLSNYFDHDTVESILHVPIGGHDKADCLIWKGDSSGLLTVKSAYHLANTSSLPPSSSNTSFYNKWWKFFWNQKLPPKIKNFGWRTFHHILPTAFNLYRKKVVPSPSCSFCGCALETVTHALLDCSRVRQVWKLSPLYHFYISHRNSDIKDFMLSAYTDLNADDFSLLMCTIWSIWEFRNKKLFRNANPDAGSLVQWITTYLSQYREAQVDHTRVVPAAQNCNHASAPRAGEGSYQLCTDAAINERSGKVGLGAVVKDWNGQVLAGVSVPFSAKLDPLMAEAMALRLGLNWCCNVRLPLSIIHTDCQQLVHKIYSHKRERSALADVILDIKNSLSHLPIAAVYHIPRDSNIHAHHMAKGALGLDKELI